jgi:hypothetical protein
MDEPEDADPDAPDRMVCPSCGPTKVIATCEGLGYVLICGTCRRFITGTSWCAIGPEWHGEVLVYRMGAESEPLLRGVVSDIWEEIERLGSPSQPVVLVPVQAATGTAPDPAA